MQQTDCIIVGLGISGTLVSYELWKAGVSFFVVDDPRPPKASLVAGALNNPVNVNQWKPVQQADVYIPLALETYQGLEQLLQVKIAHNRPMLVQKDLPDSLSPSLQEYIQWPDASLQRSLQASFRSDLPFVQVNGVWQIDAARLYHAWRRFLLRNGLILEEKLVAEECFIEPNQVRFKNITAKRIIYCEGAAASSNPFFANLPFTRNRGEALLVAIPDLDPGYIYQHTNRLVPTNDNVFWCGSNYVWDYGNLIPDETWREKTLAALQKWLKLPCKLVDHIVAERPTTAGQQLIVGIHPHISSVAVLNGLGTKGFSTGPLLARQLVENIMGKSNTVLHPAFANLRRQLQ